MQNNLARRKRLWPVNNKVTYLKVILFVLNVPKYKTKLMLNFTFRYFMYKTLLVLRRNYGLQLWGTAKKSIVIKIHAFQSIALKKIYLRPTILRSNIMLHNDLNSKTVQEKTIWYYKRLYSKLTNHLSPSLSESSSHLFTRNWRRDQLLK